MNSRFIDFHCHLDLYPDPVAAIESANAAGIYTLTVTTTPKAWPRNRDLTQHTPYVQAALGLHPQLVAERAGEIGLWEEYLPEAHYVGEVGIDAGPRFYRSLDLQKQVFERILKQCAMIGGRILTVHSVRTVKMVLDMLEAYLPPTRGRAVLHWFTGTRSEASRAVDLGCYFSINAEMLRTDRGRDLVAGLPFDRLLTETDGPFTQISGRASRPTDVKATIEALANVLGVTPADLTGAVYANMRALLDVTGVPLDR